jgi:hypothetical protein
VVIARSARGNFGLALFSFASAGSGSGRPGPFLPELAAGGRQHLGGPLGGPASALRLVFLSVAL